jgi:aspartate-semialdehyde dehydrogenase
MKSIAVLGIDSLIGSELIRILEERDFPATEVYFMSAVDGTGESIVFKDRQIEVLRGYDAFIDETDLVFCCLDKVNARAAVAKFKEKASIIDCSRAFNFAGEVDQMIPEINPDIVNGERLLIANPSPLTVQLLLALFPLHRKFRLKSLHATAFCAISDLGRDALAELSYEYEYLAVGNESSKSEDSVFPYTIGSNLIPQVGDFTGHGDTEEEIVVAKEILRMLKTEDVRIGVTAVWVPVRRGNCISVSVDFEEHVTPGEAKKVLKKAQGIKITEHDEEYPMPENVVGKDDVFVGRIRQDKIFSNGLAFWVATDNLRKGSALNAVQIAELLL